MAIQHWGWVPGCEGPQRHYAAVFQLDPVILYGKFFVPATCMDKVKVITHIFSFFTVFQALS